MLTRGRLGATAFEDEDGFYYTFDACPHRLATSAHIFVPSLVAFTIPTPFAASWRPRLRDQAHALLLVGYGEPPYETTENALEVILRLWA